MNDEQAPRRRRSLGIGAGLCALALVIPLVWTSGDLPVEVPFVDGIAWLANDGQSDVVRVNGQTGTVDARLELDDAETVSVTQGEGLVLVQVGDEIRSIDLAGLDWGESISADGELVVGEDAEGEPLCYLIRPDGTARSLDPETLQTQAEVTLAGEPGLGVIAGGQLVVPVKTGDGALVQVVEGDEVVGEEPVGDPGDRVKVSRVGDEVAVVNLTEGSIRVLDPGHSKIRVGEAIPMDVPAGEVYVPSELPAGHLWMMAIRSGDLLAVDIETGEIDIVAGVTAGRSDVAGPVVLDGHVFLVDRTAGLVIEVDGETMEEVQRHRLNLDDASQVEILVEGGRVFVNDRATSHAVVFAVDEAPKEVDKYSDEGLTVPMPPSDFTSDRGDADDEAEDEGEPDGAGVDTTPSESPPVTSAPDPAPVPQPSATVPPPPVTVPPLPDPAPATSTTTTTTATTTTTTTTTPPQVPPGSVQLTVTPGDQRSDLSWTPASSTSPVTYNISSSQPIGGQTSWTTGDTGRTFTGLSNGTSYEFTVTPSNEAGNGPTARASAVPAGAPSVSGVAVTADGDRTLRVSFSYGLNGGQLQSCTVTPSGGSSVDATCQGGSGSATVTVADYNTSYTFTAAVQTSTGPASGTATGRSRAKPLTVDGPEARWHGSCYWPDHGTSRPVFSGPVNACLEEHPPPIAWAGNGSTQRVLCYRNAVSIQDSLGNSSGVWLQREAGGWMNALYFSNWASAQNNLPVC